MEIIKKYTAIQIKTEMVDDNGLYDKLNINLTYGDIDGTHYSKNYPTEEFDTENEAIEYAYKKDKWIKWLIVPVIKFDNF